MGVGGCERGKVEGGEGGGEMGEVLVGVIKGEVNFEIYIADRKATTCI